MTSTFFNNATGFQTFESPPRILIVGAGSRGTAYAEATISSTNAVIAAVCEPVAYKRNELGRKYIWGKHIGPLPGQAFADWREWKDYEVKRRARERDGEEVEHGIGAVFVCVLDELHEEVVTGIAGLGVHICCEKPMSTRLGSCVNIYNALNAAGSVDGQYNTTANGETGAGPTRKETIFGICHVLRYSPHNMLLRQLVRGEQVIGDVLSIEHVEPIGWWHYSHSYVRGNWRKESKSAPSLLTKSCHDIDFLMWMLCSPPPGAESAKPHLPSFITSTGSRKFFRKARKPKAAGEATRCVDCAHEQDCDYSAKKIYWKRHLESGNTGWPVNIVSPEIEEIYKIGGKNAAVRHLLNDLTEDYTSETPAGDVEARPWFGRCVWEADNDVCDDQYVTIDWEDDAIDKDCNGHAMLEGRAAKTAQFHMVAHTEKICERRGRIYGTRGEMEYDGKSIKVHNFSTGHTVTHSPPIAGGGHGGGDEGLARQFLMGVNAVNSGTMSATDAQREFLGCDLEEAFRSHAMVFAAEEARTKRQVVDWKKWWNENVEPQLHT